MEVSADEYLWTRPTLHIGTTAAPTPEKDPEVEIDEGPVASGKCSPAGTVTAAGSWRCSECAGAERGRALGRMLRPRAEGEFGRSGGSEAERAIRVPAVEGGAGAGGLGASHLRAGT